MIPFDERLKSSSVRKEGWIVAWQESEEDFVVRGNKFLIDLKK